MKPVTYNFIAADAAYICASQTTGAAGALTINGTGAELNPTPRVRLSVGSPGFQRVVTITSAGNISSVNFTITGKDVLGNAVTETRAGPNATTVSTTAEFYEITSVTADAAVSSAATLGIGATGTSQWFVVDYQLTPINIGVQCAVTGTINYTVQQTRSDISSGNPPSAQIFSATTAGLVGATTSQQGSIYETITASRVLINSSSGGALHVRYLQAGIV